MVYAGSEGEGGLIARDLRDALALVVGLPSLHDALARPLTNELPDWLRDIDEQIRREDAERPARLDEARTRVQQELKLPQAYGLLAALHAAATDEAYRPISEYGPYEPMLRS